VSVFNAFDHVFCYTACIIIYTIAFPEIQTGFLLLFSPVTCLAHGAELASPNDEIMDAFLTLSGGRIQARPQGSVDII
jgi:hypothetical protein